MRAVMIARSSARTDGACECLFVGVNRAITGTATTDRIAKSPECPSPAKELAGEGSERDARDGGQAHTAHHHAQGTGAVGRAGGLRFDDSGHGTEGPGR